MLFKQTHTLSLNSFLVFFYFKTYIFLFQNKHYFCFVVVFTKQTNKLYLLFLVVVFCLQTHIQTYVSCCFSLSSTKVIFYSIVFCYVLLFFAVFLLLFYVIHNNSKIKLYYLLFCPLLLFCFLFIFWKQFNFIILGFTINKQMLGIFCFLVDFWFQPKKQTIFFFLLLFFSV